MHFDVYRNRFVGTWRPGGNANPLQRVALAIARRQYRGAAAGSSSSHGVTADRVANHPRSLDAPNPVVPVARAQLESRLLRRGSLLLRPTITTSCGSSFGTPACSYGRRRSSRAHLSTVGSSVSSRSAPSPRICLCVRGAWVSNPALIGSRNPPKSSFLGVLEIVANTTEQEDLDAALTRRHTNRRFFRGPPMTAREKEGLETEVAATPGARLLWLDDRDTRRRALQLIRIAERERFRDRHLHEELFSGIRFDVGWHSAAPEGLAPGSLEVEAPLRRAFATAPLLAGDAGPQPGWRALASGHPGGGVHRAASHPTSPCWRRPSTWSPALLPSGAERSSASGCARRSRGTHFNLSRPRRFLPSTGTRRCDPRCARPWRLDGERSLPGWCRSSSSAWGARAKRV